MNERTERRLSIRFVNAHYAPDIAASGEYLTDLAEGLALLGHNVHVITGATPYQIGVLDAPEEEVRRGVRVTRVRAPEGPGRGAAQRVYRYLSFLLGATPSALGGGDVDITIYLTTPPLLGAIGALGRTLRRPYGLWVMDLHPEAEVAHGMLKPTGPVARALFALDRVVFRRATFVAALGRCMASRIEAKLPPGRRVPSLPLWKSAEEVKPTPRQGNPYARSWGIRDEFIVMYSGNAGLAHRFDEVRRMLVHFRDDPGIVTLFIGGGQRRLELEGFLRDERIPNARYLDYVPREDLGLTLTLADVHLVTLQPSWSGIAVPSKLFGIMASARPVAMVGPLDSEVSRIIEESGAGRVIEPGPEAATELIDFIKALRSDPGLGKLMGAAGRAALERDYTRRAGVARWLSALQQALAG